MTPIEIVFMKMKQCTASDKNKNKPYSISRRQFVKYTAVGAGMTLLGCHSLEEKEQTVPALIIGSGFGGAITALRLTQAGIPTILLERGRRWTLTAEEDTFPTTLKPDHRSAWFSPKPVLLSSPQVDIDLYAGLMDLIHEEGIDVVVGAGVGGGSLVYGGVTLQPKKEIFSKVFPPELDYSELDRIYYPRVLAMLKSQTLPEDILNTEHYLTARHFIQEAKNAGLPYEFVKTAFDYDAVRQELSGKKKPSLIVGEVIYGNNSGAKNSLDRNYLAQSEESGLLELQPLHQVTDISFVAGIGYRVDCQQITEYGQIVQRKLYYTRRLFLAAGSMGTSKLLVRAKALGRLPELNEYIGQAWGNNGDLLISRQKLAKNTGILQGQPDSLCITSPNNVAGPNALELAPIPTPFECNCLFYLSMGVPKGEGQFRYDSLQDKVILNWPKTAMQNVRDTTLETLAKLNQANGGENFEPDGFGDKSTFHPLGGAVLGKACDFYGRVKGYQGLYVMDGALIPGSTACANPALTIAAIAERNIERILVEDFNKA